MPKHSVRISLIGFSHIVIWTGNSFTASFPSSASESDLSATWSFAIIRLYIFSSSGSLQASFAYATTLLNQWYHLATSLHDSASSP